MPVGRSIQQTAGERLAKVCLELGGKNPLVVCDDADLDAAAAGRRAVRVQQRRPALRRRAAESSSSTSVYDEFRRRFLRTTAALTTRARTTTTTSGRSSASGSCSASSAPSSARDSGDGVTLACGGERLDDPAHAGGYYVAPTVLENAAPDAGISRDEVFGPVTCLYRVAATSTHALKLANDTQFGLTAAIHTRSIHRAEAFRERVRAGVVSINGPTYGSEPHMPFGGLKDSGNGFREAGTEVLDVYSDWKTVYVKHDPGQV